MTAGGPHRVKRSKTEKSEKNSKKRLHKTSPKMTPKMTLNWPPKWSHLGAINGSKTVSGRLRDRVRSKNPKNAKFDYPLHVVLIFWKGNRPEHGSKMRPNRVKNASQKHSENICKKGAQKCSQKGPKREPKTTKNSQTTEKIENMFFFSNSQKSLFSFFRVEN